MLYLSRYIVRNKAPYYGLLMRVTKDHAWEDWLLYMLHATADTAMWTLGKIQAIRETIFVQPYTRIENLIDAGIAKRQTARAICIS